MTTPHLVFRMISLLFLTVAAAAAGNDETCTLKCPNDAPCQFGVADFSDHVLNQDHTHQDGMHCSCPYGWTGVLCDHKYESCDQSHKCYHGGECIPGMADKFGNDQLFCDCSQAVASDGTRYVGKYCETPFEQTCNEEGTEFCVNGGDCNPDYPYVDHEGKKEEEVTYDATPCLCPSGWEGKHCEFKRGSVPECTLDCQNEGRCVIGIRDPAEAKLMNHVWSHQEIEEHMQCLCTEDYGGPLCEAPADSCGNFVGGGDGNDDETLFCYHGGTCIETTIGHEDVGYVTTEYHCDCTTAAFGGSLFAGKYCQHESTQLCSDTDENLFCTNGKDMEPARMIRIKDATVPMDGYVPTTMKDELPILAQSKTGFKCEYADESYFNDDDESDDDTAFGGVELCGDVYCFNNGKCVTKSLTLEDGTTGTSQTCDCSQTFDGKHYWAGSSCQYRSTDICTDDDAGDNAMFCVHSGECPTDGAKECSCPEGWKGDHCEIHIYALEDEYPEASTCGEDRVCLNGGICTSTEVLKPDGAIETEYHCDCSSAFDEKFHYAGESCQFPSTQVCTHDGDSMEGRLFCTNHGSCQEDPERGCKCRPGYSGFSCEFENTEDDPTDRESIDFGKCGDDLVCHNGGVCVTTLLYSQDGGEKEVNHCDCSTATTETTAWFSYFLVLTVSFLSLAPDKAGDMCQYEATSFCSEPLEGLGLESAYFCVNHGECNPENVRHGCDCPPDWNGMRCEYQETADDLNDDTEDGVPCGDDLVCYNSGTCEAIESTNEATGDKTTIYECNCGPATDGTNFFAGPQCEYRSSDTCSDENPGGSFCVNGGKCAGGPLDGCECPSGWSGTMCDVAVEGNAHADKGEECGNGYCYNGGSCIKTTINSVDGNSKTEFHCSCEGAYDDEHRYGGLYCEHKSTTFCSRSNQGDSLAGVHFCSNGGTCDEENPQKGCKCPAGWTGMSCEFQTNEQSNSGEEEFEACGDLTCLNGGTCVTTIVKDSQGVKTAKQHCDCSSAYTDSDIFAGIQCEYKQTSFCSDPGDDISLANFCTNSGTCGDSVLAGCDCPDHFTGFRCEYQKDVDDLINQADHPQVMDEFVECGDDFCYNGGTCEPYPLDNGRTDYRCNCETAATNSTLYAGKHCQYEMTSLCTKGTLDSMDSADFCVNNGKCPKDDKGGGCLCPSGYGGYRCDEPLYANYDSEDNVTPNISTDDDNDDKFYRCRLQCQNGGVCAKGAKDLTDYHDAIDHVAHLNKTYDETYFEHCVCPSGWFGLECEHKAEVCGADEHLCLHGSKCVKNNEEHGCDCSQTDEKLDGSDHSLFAGDSCQHPATDICTYGSNSPGRPLYFCTNHGTCKDYVTPAESNPGCDCPAGWTGPHCEVRGEAKLPVSRQPSSGGDVVPYIVGGVCVVIGIAAFAYLICHRSKEDDPSTSCMPFRRRRRRAASFDPSNQSNNLAPKRSSTFSPDDDDMNPPPSRSFSSSFRSGSDPMTAFEMPPEPYRDDPGSQYKDESFEDEPDDEPEPHPPAKDRGESEILVNVGPSTDEDGNRLHNVDFL
eukprot:scaffold1336_cov158-Cylindrotheca_fusiformis.AAC.7